MKIVYCLIIFGLILSLSMPAYSGEVSDEDRDRDSGNQALTGALMGGLLGAGLGAAVGSASGHAGQGAAIGAGVGAVGGTVLGASQQSEKRQTENTYKEPKSLKPSKIKKKIVREYDEHGNVISEREVKN